MAPVETPLLGGPAKGAGYPEHRFRWKTAVERGVDSGM